MSAQQLTEAENLLAAGRAEDAIRLTLEALAKGDAGGRGLVILAECLLQRPDIALTDQQGRAVDALMLLLDGPAIDARSAPKQRFTWQQAIARASSSLPQISQEMLLDALGASLVPPEEYLQILRAVSLRDPDWARLMHQAEQCAADGSAHPDCTDEDLDAAARQQAWLTYWRLRPNANLAIELVLTAIRRRLLEHAVVGRPLPTAWQEMAASLAVQAHLNEFVWREDETETIWLATIKGRAADTDGWLVAAMYRDAAEAQQPLPVDLSSRGGAIADLIYFAVDAPRQRRQIVDELPTIGTSADTITSLVRDFYEATPYPRWRHGYDISFATPYANWLAGRFPGIAEPDFARAPRLDLLVAGCGTGHALINPLQYQGARITAIDLSRSSLAYARQMVEACGRHDVDFHHGDLRRISALGRQFDVVECTGVVHHMADPWEGVAALVEVLRPGGHLLLSIYSRHFRDLLQPAMRIAHAAAGGSATPREQVQAARAAVLAGRRTIPHADLVMTMQDFFLTSDCRDLLLHPVEHPMTVQEMVAGAARFGLQPLGLFLANPFWRLRAEQYRQAAGLAPGVAAWAGFEADQPAAFDNMINLLLAKTG